MLHGLPGFLSFRLHEQEGFEPALSAFEFQTFLYNLTDLRISNAGGRNCECAAVGGSARACRHARASPAPRTKCRTHVIVGMMPTGKQTLIPGVTTPPGVQTTLLFLIN